MFEMICKENPYHNFAIVLLLWATWSKISTIQLYVYLSKDFFHQNFYILNHVQKNIYSTLCMDCTVNHCLTGSRRDYHSSSSTRGVFPPLSLPLQTNETNDLGFSWHRIFIPDLIYCFNSLLEQNFIFICILMHVQLTC